MAIPKGLFNQGQFDKIMRDGLALNRRMDYSLESFSRE